MSENTVRTSGGSQGVVRSGPPSAWSQDLQSLLTQAVLRLAQATGCTRVAAFSWRADGEPCVLAATADAAGPHDGARVLLDGVLARAAAAGRGTMDLGLAAIEPPVRERAAQLGFSAAAPIGPPEEATPVLLIGGPRDPAGRVRPATLAALDAAALRLAAPVQAAGAASRLATLGEEVRRIDALASLGELVAEIVHEVRNPLVSVKTFLQLLPDRVNDPEFRTQFLDVVGEEVRRIERLLSVVLDQARPEHRPAETDGSDPRPVLEAVARLLAHRAQERGVTLQVEAAHAVAVPMSADSLHQVVLNLAMNALDATPPDGHVRLLALQAEGAARIACDDEGPGIPAALRERVFEPFFSTKPDRPGGLGLSIARRMVLESGGALRVEDRKGGGTRIALAWPRPSP